MCDHKLCVHAEQGAGCLFRAGTHKGSPVGNDPGGLSPATIVVLQAQRAKCRWVRSSYMPVSAADELARNVRREIQLRYHWPSLAGVIGQVETEFGEKK